MFSVQECVSEIGSSLLERLPAELLEQIFAYLIDYSDIYALALLNVRMWSLWHRYIKLHLAQPTSALPINGAVTMKASYAKGVPLETKLGARSSLLLCRSRGRVGRRTGLAPGELALPARPQVGAQKPHDAIVRHGGRTDLQPPTQDQGRGGEAHLPPHAALPHLLVRRPGRDYQQYHLRAPRRVVGHKYDIVPERLFELERPRQESEWRDVSSGLERETAEVWQRYCDLSSDADT
ncbi:MAG: hypothetical protein M1829_000210 [Trizodia sp. TS-e1964]|nr:MAG: hypothetical protein M1829_000210 [Trizodia sp. TS-e1964]